MLDLEGENADLEGGNARLEGRNARLEGGNEKCRTFKQSALTGLMGEGDEGSETTLSALRHGILGNGIWSWSRLKCRLAEYSPGAAAGLC